MFLLVWLCVVCRVLLLKVLTPVVQAEVVLELVMLIVGGHRLVLIGGVQVQC